MIRSLTGLLDEWMPIIAGSEILDDPYDPVSRHARDLVAEQGEDTPDRVGPPRRPLRREAGHARHLDRRPDRRGRPHQGGRGPLPLRRADPALRPGAPHQPRHLRHQRAARPRRAHPGRPAQRAGGARHPGPGLQDPPAARRAARGLGQPRGLHQPRPDHHPAEGPLRRPDPHPLPARRRDRDGRSCDQEARPLRRATACGSTCPPFMAEVVATISQLARQSPHINQRSGVSVRLTVANYETLVANAARRALRLGETDVVPRISDLEALVASTSGKVEIETLEEGRDGQIIERLIQQARPHRVPASRFDLERAAAASLDCLRRGHGWCTPARTSARPPTTRPWPPRCPALREASVGPGRATSPRPRWPAPSSSSSRACTSPSGSTRTRPAAAPPTGAG